MDITRCRQGKFLLVSTFATRCLHICKAGRDPSGERWNFCREGSPVIFHKWPLLRSLSNCFLISETVLVRTKFFVSVCSTYRLSLPCMLLDHDSCQVMKFVYMRTTCSIAIQNMGLNLEFNLTKQLVFILLCLYLICAEYEFETFRSTFNGIWLYVNGILSTYRSYRQYLETIHSTSDEIGIITKDLYLTCTDN